MYDFDSLKNVYENYDIIGHVAYNNKTGQYIDLSNPMYINVLFANLWVFATNYKEEKFNIYNSIFVKIRIKPFTKTRVLPY